MSLSRATRGGERICGGLSPPDPTEMTLVMEEAETLWGMVEAVEVRDCSGELDIARPRVAAAKKNILQ